MPEDRFWACLREITEQLSGQREKSEQLMERLTTDLRELPESARHDLRGDLMMVVGELARLSTRISEME
jgi:hypothetical protein